MTSHKRKLVAPSPRASAIKEIQLVNRVEEMYVLREAADRAASGQGGVVFLYGEAGIGKTRLARELGAYARSRGMQVLWGRCPALFRMDGAPPYALWEEVIRNYLEVCTPEQLHRVIGSYPVEVSKLIPELKQKLRTFPQSFPLSPEHSRDRLFEAVSQLITNISRDGPLIVILDDLQWTDQSSLLLLHYLARGVYKESLLLVGAYRDTFADEERPLSLVLTELNRERLLQSVQLKRVSFDDTSEMIGRIFGQDDVPREFCELVYEKTRGNPFFVEEVIKSLKEEEVIQREGDKWTIKGISKIEFPKTVKSVVKSRINRLDDESQNVLTLASFIGRDFTFEALHGVTGIEEDKLLEIMEKMLKTGLIDERVIHEEEGYSFADFIVRDVVYEEISRLRRKRLHSVVGVALEKVYSENIDEHFGELAYHFLESGDKAKASDYFLKAGDRAQKVYALAESFSYLQRALELLEENKDNSGEKARIIERLGDLKMSMGGSDCVEYFNKSLALWDPLVDRKDVARLHSKIASWLWQFAGDRDRASEHHHKALEILEKEPESVELAGLYEDISHMLWRRGSAEEAFSWTRKAYELAEKLGNPQVLAGCNSDLGTLYAKSGEFEKARRHYEQGLKIALENKVVGHAVALYNNLAELYFTTAEFQKAFETAQKGSDFTKKIGSLYGIAWIDSQLAWSYVYMGELEKAIPIFEDILALARRIKYSIHVSGAMSGLGQCYRLLGELEKSLQHITEAREIAKKIEEYQFSGLAAVSLGSLFTEMEDYGEAEKHYNESRNIFEKAAESSTLLLYVFPDLSMLYLKKGEIRKAKELIEKIYDEASKAENRLVTQSAEMLKAVLLREQRDWEHSIQYFEKSLQGLKSMNAQKWYVIQLAELLYEYGLMHLNRNEEGDKERASSLLSQSLEIYKKMNAKRRMEKIKARMAHLETTDQVIETEPVAMEVSKVVRPDRVSTGYKDLDNLLMGGIPPNYAVILTSPSCDERDLLIKKYLETGIKRGEATFYVTIDPSEAKSLAEEFSNFYLFICNPQADKIIRDLPNVFKLKGVENLNDINIALTSALRMLDTSVKSLRRGCIGIISDILLQHRAVQTRRWLTGLLTELKSKNFTTLAIIDPGMHPSEEFRATVDLFEGEINVYEKETKEGLEKLVRIKRMHNEEYSTGEVALKKEKLKE